jgi:hypothetical protein
MKLPSKILQVEFYLLQLISRNQATELLGDDVEFDGSGAREKVN